jgi:hypothetical protein
MTTFLFRIPFSRQMILWKFFFVSVRHKKRYRKVSHILYSITLIYSLFLSREVSNLSELNTKNNLIPRISLLSFKNINILYMFQTNCHVFLIQGSFWLSNLFKHNILDMKSYIMEPLHFNSIVYRMRWKYCLEMAPSVAAKTAARTQTTLENSETNGEF